MKLLHIFTVLATMALVSAAFDLDDYNEEPEMQSTESTVPESEMHEATTSLRGVSRFLTSQTNPLGNYTCDKFPRVCRLKKSSGPDCCKKKCVNVKTDRLNCGMCGYKCKYTEICCRGKCVNASFDKRHCGGCNQKCKRGEFYRHHVLFNLTTNPNFIKLLSLYNTNTSISTV
ncbi:hypothetical protein ACLB2K_033266 [Fragaria x ananassa]